jgi:prepilin-type N-terminal cleavage/methylation domain-containing protein
MLKKLKKNKKGFTLAELLIVVAIIGVLVAISIPIFTGQLEKAREATDLANMRSAYAECSAAVLAEQDTGKAKISSTDGSASETVSIVQKKTGWTGTNADAKIGSYAVKANELFKYGVPASVTVKVAADGTVTIK